MDHVRNPFAPGAGSQPPELAGRETIIADARTALQRALAGKHSRSQILLGLRGVGKTVLLNKIEEAAEEFGHHTSFVEAPEGRKLSELIVPRAQQLLRKLSLQETAKAKAVAGLRALRAFASAFKLNYGEYGLSVEPEAGVADSGNLEYDLSDLFVRIGEAATAAGKGWTLLIDEIQYLREPDLAALIVAMHKCNQKGLPVLLFGAGLPQVAALSGDAKSYAERLPMRSACPSSARTKILSPRLWTQSTPTRTDTPIFFRNGAFRRGTSQVHRRSPKPRSRRQEARRWLGLTKASSRFALIASRRKSVITSSQWRSWAAGHTSRPKSLRCWGSRCRASARDGPASSPKG